MNRILVIGGGSIGERHVRCMLATGGAAVSLCEIDRNVRERLASDYALDAVFESFDEALQREFDGAVICTPAHLHVPMARRLAQRNIALLIEKPLSTSTEGVDALIDDVNARCLPAGVAYVLRHHPALQSMRRAIHEGRFGRAVQLTLCGGQHFPFYRPAYREIYYRDRATGGGAIQDALTHMLNAAEWLVGPITRLVADADHCVLADVRVEDTVHVLTRHDEVLGSFSLNQHQAVNESSLTVACENGIVRLDGRHNRWLSCSEPDTDWVVEESFDLVRDDLFVRQASAFLDQIAGSAKPVCSLEEARQTLRVNLAALQSWEEGKWIEI